MIDESGQSSGFGVVIETALTDAERAKLRSADAKTAWAECEALRSKVAELEAALSTDAEPVKPYGYVVELRTTRVQHQNAIVRSRVQPYLQVANACVEHWKTIYAEDHWLFEIVPLFAAPPAPSVAVKALEWRDNVADAITGDYWIVNATQKWLYREPNTKVAPFNTIEAAKDAAQIDYEARIRSALSAQVQDVAGWQPIDGLKPDHGQEVLGWIEVCGNFCTHPIYFSAFSRTWRRKLDGAEVDEVTHYQPLPAAPAAKLEEKP